jgi:outer membrane murein-binding lipoprotein Lpp
LGIARPAQVRWPGANKRGIKVLVRAGFIVAAGLTCAGCANERPETSLYYQAASLHAAPSAPTTEADVEAAIESGQAAKKTLGAKVLTAIALERVTGRRPDPARLADLN